MFSRAEVSLHDVSQARTRVLRPRWTFWVARLASARPRFRSDKALGSDLTLCCSVPQLRQPATTRGTKERIYVSPFVGRLDDVGQNGLGKEHQANVLDRGWPCTGVSRQYSCSGAPALQFLLEPCLPEGPTMGSPCLALTQKGIERFFAEYRAVRSSTA